MLNATLVAAGRCLCCLLETWFKPGCKNLFSDLSLCFLDLVCLSLASRFVFRVSSVFVLNVCSNVFGLRTAGDFSLYLQVVITSDPCA